MVSEREGDAPVLVLGLGNLLLQDDGIGLELLLGLRRVWGEDPRVAFVDGGTLGLALAPLLAGRSGLLLLDAISRGAVPGTVHALRQANAVRPRGSAGAAGGAHQQNAGDLLAVAELLGDLPPRVAAVGVEPAMLGTGIGLSAGVRAAVPEAVAAARSCLAGLIASAAGEAPCTS